MVYYNEINPQKAAWLRELVKRNVIAEGIVDERSIRDVQPGELAGYTQCHFFAGIGVWSYALRLAGWPDDRQVWTGSCPCQPFSVAGRRGGTSDERHLWPEWFRLIDACRPPQLFGEQVASPDALEWFDGPIQGLQTMRDQQTVFRVLREFERESSLQMQRLCQSGFGETKERESGGHEVILQELAGGKSGESLSNRSEVSRQSEGFRIQLESGEYSIPHQSWSLRIDRDSFRSEKPTVLERAVLGPDRFGEGLYRGQRASGSLLGKRDGEYLGSSQDFGDIVGDCEEAEYRLRDVFSALDGEPSEESFPVGLYAVRFDLEKAGYSCGAFDLCAAGIGAPHIRQRLYFGAVRLADSADQRHDGRGSSEIGRHGFCECLEHPASIGRDPRRPEPGERSPESGCGDVRLGSPSRTGLEERVGKSGNPRAEFQTLERTGAVNGFWANADWVLTNPKRVGDPPSIRPVEPNSFPLANGAPFRVLRLCGYGDAIVAPLAAEFVKVWEETVPS